MTVQVWDSNEGANHEVIGPGAWAYGSTSGAFLDGMVHSSETTRLEFLQKISQLRKNLANVSPKFDGQVPPTSRPTRVEAESA